MNTLWIPLTRRAFLGGIAGVAALTLGGSVTSSVAQQMSQPGTASDSIAYYNQSGAFHNGQVRELSARGYRLTSLSMYGKPSNRYYAALWMKRSGPDWYPFDSLDWIHYRQLAANRGKQGYRPTILTALGAGQGVRLAGVFEQDATPFIMKSDLLINADRNLANGPDERDPATLQYWQTWAMDKGYILRWGTLYGDVDQPLFAGIWEYNQDAIGWNWDAGFYDTAAQYRDLLQAETAQWVTPAFVTLSQDQHTLSHFRDDGVNARLALHGLTSNDYRGQAQQLAQQGYVPLVLQGAGTGNAIRFSAIFARQTQQPGQRVWTATGTQEPSLSAFDTLLQAYMRDHGIRAASLAIAREGKLMLARAYTWAEPGYPITQPVSLFRTASCTKPLTSIVIHQLIERGLLTLDTPMQQLLALQTPQGGIPRDGRFGAIRVWHLLSHLAGWDREQSFDPLLDEGDLAAAMHVSLPVNKYQVASFMAGRQLQSAPGTHIAYSNLGFCLLGQMIERVMGLPYQKVLQSQLYGPLGLTRPRLGRSLLTDQAASEVRYHSAFPITVPSVLSAERPLVPAPYGSIHVENNDADGGQIMAAADYAKILAAFDLKSNPLLQPASVAQMWSEPPGFAGSNVLRGWFKGMTEDGHTAIGHDGFDPGSETMIFRRSDALSFIVFFNKDFQTSLAIDGNGNTLSNALSRTAQAVSSWPQKDLFPALGIPSFFPS